MGRIRWFGVPDVARMPPVDDHCFIVYTLLRFFLFLVEEESFGVQCNLSFNYTSVAASTLL